MVHTLYNSVSTKHCMTSHTVSPPVISWSLVSPITDLLDTQYSVMCNTTINPTLVYWTVNDSVVNNTTLLLYPNNDYQGQSVTITCSVEGVRNDTLILQGI